MNNAVLYDYAWNNRGWTSCDYLNKMKINYVVYYKTEESYNHSDSSDLSIIFQEHSCLEFFSQTDSNNIINSVTFKVN